MDLRLFQSELSKYPIKRRSDYCKAYTKKSTNDDTTPKALTNLPSKSKSEVPSPTEDKDLDFWEYLYSKLDADDLELSALEKSNFKKTFQVGHKAAILKLNLEDLDMMAHICGD